MKIVKVTTIKVIAADGKEFTGKNAKQECGAYEKVSIPAQRRDEAFRKFLTKLGACVSDLPLLYRVGEALPEFSKLVKAHPLKKSTKKTRAPEPDKKEPSKSAKPDKADKKEPSKSAKPVVDKFDEKKPFVRISYTSSPTWRFQVPGAGLTVQEVHALIPRDKLTGASGISYYVGGKGVTIPFPR